MKILLLLLLETITILLFIFQLIVYVYYIYGFHDQTSLQLKLVKSCPYYKLIHKLRYAEGRSYVSVKRCDSYHCINNFRGMHVIPKYVFCSVRTNRSVLRTKLFTRVNRTATPITNSDPYNIHKNESLQVLD